MATGSAPACSSTADGLRFSSVMLTERVAHIPRKAGKPLPPKIQISVTGFS
jgi:hypothetical protein